MKGWQLPSCLLLQLLYFLKYQKQMLFQSVATGQHFSTSAPLSFGARSFCVVGACPVHCWVFSCISELYPIDVSSSCSVATTKNGSRHGQMFSGRKNHPGWEGPSVQKHTPHSVIPSAKYGSGMAKAENHGALRSLQVQVDWAVHDHGNCLSTSRLEQLVCCVQ